MDQGCDNHLQGSYSSIHQPAQTRGVSARRLEGDILTAFDFVKQVCRFRASQPNRRTSPPHAPQSQGLGGKTDPDPHARQCRQDKSVESSRRTCSAPASMDDWALIDELKRRAYHFQTETSLVAYERDGLVAELRKQTAWNAHLEQRLQQQEEDTEKHKEQAIKFRSILTAQARDDNEPLDATLIQSFQRLRESVFKIVQRYYRPSGQFTLDPDREEFPQQQEWLGSVDPTIADRKSRMRGIVYKLLDDEILGAACFGQKGRVEEVLSNIEEAMKSRRSDRASEISEWRSLTVQRTRWLGCSDERSRWATATIWNHLLPWLKPAVNPHASTTVEANHHRIKNEIKTLCDHALNLALTLRASKSRFVCYSFSEGDSVDDAEDSPMMLQAFEGPQPANLMDAKIAFTVFGGLLKSDDLNPKGHVVLEKAHVVAHA
ncbi:MAG: 8-oxoguanine glycosylase ogg1 [Watsoniomyces obsoletus]|nr:MAG: 8-oxoguanine glycosylase ogg1 [Watsoniomyces obsoletus]